MLSRFIPIIVLIAFLQNMQVFAQDYNKYRSYTTTAFNLLKAKKYKESAATYENAFEVLNGKGVATDRYNTACAYALAGNTDKAFYYLFYLAEKVTNKYKKYDYLKSDNDLVSLHKDSRWAKLLKIVRQNAVSYESKLNKVLVSILDDVFKEDQKYRKQIAGIAKDYGWDSKQMSDLKATIRKVDSINLIKVKKILNKYGWLGADVITQQGNTTLFLVIQHSDLKTQEQYLPLLREAVKKGNATPNNLAFVEDRVAIGKGGKQIYGSQIGRNKETGEFYVLPLVDPDNVNKRRAKIGLGKIEAYVLSWGIEWKSKN